MSTEILIQQKVMTLTEQLAEKQAASAEMVPAEQKAIMQASTEKLKKELLSKNALKTGATLPDFKLSNANGESVSLKDFDHDFLVVSFYRGGWCPYCNLELKALQDILPKLSELNAELIAISPETPDNSLDTKEKNELSFAVLSDVNNVYAKSLGLVFQLPEDLRAVYKGFGIDVQKHNGNEDFELPMPATYVINKHREVILSFVPEDYTERLEPETILSTISSI